MPSPNQRAPRDQMPLPEEKFADQLAFLAAYDKGPRPPGWLLTPAAVVTFICGGEGLHLADGSGMDIPAKFIGDPALVQRCVVTLAGSRGLMLVGEPGTAKSMLSELLATAICGSSTLSVQGSAGTTEDQIRYGWNYGMLLTEGPTLNALVPSPIMSAMRMGKVARVEELTRCQPEIQDALLPILSERRMSIPELGEYTFPAQQGFCVIATANLRDRGVSEMSAALKRRFNFEHVHPISSLEAETSLVTSQATYALEAAQVGVPVDEAMVAALVAIFHDLRKGYTREGWRTEKPSAIMSTAEAVSIATAISMDSSYFSSEASLSGKIPAHLLGAVNKDDPKDIELLATYFDTVVRKRAQANPESEWAAIWENRDVLRL